VAESGEKPVALRLRLAFTSVEAFEEGYARFVTAKGIFLASKRPRAVGTALRFELQTRDGQRLLLAEGRVVGAREADPRDPRRVPGMHVRFTRLTQESRERIQRMLGEDEPKAAGSEAAEPEAVAAEPEATPAPDIEPAPEDVDPDAVPAPTPAQIVDDQTERTPGPDEPPLKLPDPGTSPFRDVFVRLFGMGGGTPPPDDPFEEATLADLPPADGAPLEDVPELPPDVLLD